MRTYLSLLWTLVRVRIESLKEQPEAGYTTEAVVGIALLVLIAIATFAVIAAKVANKAESIDLGL
ncbi:hypothetical protein [Actinophytocola oryzae]|uniref:Uncharacterized protein n=1 Tax=Actinophytocola oryzae TaxID=502181 RepID=A0A4R7V862_9PSEU|nr:hypothetical protein [Actinophytocola oryzae]TDV44166.1 hypothetical protein CLV71_11475 [Actinophytocola oryzae]